jgi:hypothetical protein
MTNNTVMGRTLNLLVIDGQIVTDREYMQMKINQLKLEEEMDRQINKVKEDVKEHKISKAKKDLTVLSKMDKKFDKKLAEKGIVKKKKM